MSVVRVTSSTRANIARASEREMRETRAALARQFRAAFSVRHTYPIGMDLARLSWRRIAA